MILEGEKIMKRLFSAILVMALLVGLVLPCLPTYTHAAIVDNEVAIEGFSGLKLSVIGDSISSYEGVSNNKTYNPLYLSTAEATFGTYYGNTTHSDYDTYAEVTRKDTWWQQVADTLDMQLLVNNSWSGSFIVKDPALGNNTEYGVAAYKDRCVNLHIGENKPDMIAVFLGTNDIGNYTTTKIGSKADIDTASERNALYTNVGKFSTPSTSIAAYYIMLSRMVDTYPKAEIYCMLPTIWQDDMASGYTDALNTFNEGVRYLVDYFAEQGSKVYLVDLAKDCGLVNDPVVRDYYYCNDVHPGLAGMDMISTCVLSEIVEHSTKRVNDLATHKVSYNLSQTYAKAGLPRCIIDGQPLEVNMLPYTAGQEVELTVTMKDASGKVIEIPGGGVLGHSVYIPEVTGDVTVTANSAPKDSFHWKLKNGYFAAATGIGYDYNRATLKSGKYNSGEFQDAYYALDRSVTLKHDQPWVLEYKGGGTYAGGILLTSRDASAPTVGNTYIHINQSYVLFGYRTDVGYNNSGISWATIASKMGSSAGANYRTETHVFRFENVPNGTKNKIYLYVDGVKIGSMDSAKLIGSNANHASASSVNISGRDFTFNYIGSSTFPLRGCSMDYLKIWENGQSAVEDGNYRWDMNDSGNGFVSAENQFFTDNELRQMAGSISNGVLTNTYFEFDKQVVLMHDVKWNVEWVTSGDWMDARTGGMLLSSSDGHNDRNAYYLYKRNGTSFIALGEWDGSHNNYGVNLADHGIDATVRHKYTLSNEVKTDSKGAYVSNMVYLYVDDVKLGAMNQYFNGGSITGTTSDWVNGKDFTFSYLGNKGFTVGSCTLEYLQISVDCVHDYKSTVVHETCTENGYTIHTCTLCGDSYTDSIVECVGHSWSNASCTDARACVICGVTDGNALGHSYSSTVIAPTCDTDGYTTHTCTRCGDSYVSNKITASGHMWSEATCAEPKICFICGASEGGLADHTWSGYTCTGCDLTRDFYLFGFINGANYGCENDYTNMGQYKFVDGKLTVSFDVDSYIGIKTTDNGAWYMTQAYVTDSVATFYNTDTGAGEKMLVPGGVDVTFYLTLNADDSLMLSYDTKAKPVIPTLTLNYPSLSFEDEILYNVYYSVDDPTLIEEMGLITFSTKLEEGTIADAVNVIRGYINSGETYMVQSKGIPAKNLGDALYFKVYAKLTDGSYVYSGVAGYNAVAYAKTVLSSTTSSIKAKALMVAMLNYGAAAQEYFGYNTDAPMNAFLSDAGKALVSDYDENMVNDVIKADPAKVGSFIMNGGYTNIFPTVSFEGAFSINYYFTPSKTVSSSVSMSFVDASARTLLNDGMQVWEANGIKLTNDRAGATSKVADYVNPVRFYKGSDVTVEYASMTELVVVCPTAAYAQVWRDTNTDSNATVTIVPQAGSSDYVVTVKFSVPTDSFELTTLTGQTRISELSVTSSAINSVVNPVMYYWDSETYNSVSVLSPENATGVIAMTQDGDNWGAAVEGIAAKSIDETVYVAGFYTGNGVSYPTGIIAYSLGKYCQTIAANGEAFGAATAVYGYYAKAYFS